MQLTKEQTAQILSNFGYELDKSFKFRLRSDDKTPSASINPKDGKIKDFGSGWYGDAVDFLVEFQGFEFKEAFSTINQMLGKETNSIKFTNFQTQSHTQNQYKDSFISKEYIDKFALERKENFTRYWELLSQTLPTSSSETKKEIAQKYEIGYSKKADRLIMPIKDENGNCVTFWKYNKHPTPFQNQKGEIIQLPKLMFSKNRKRCPFNLRDLKEFKKQSNEPLFIVEGEKDCLNAIANGFNAVTLGSAAVNIEKEHIPLFSGFSHIVIAYDYDEAGKSGAARLKEQILKDKICSSIEILDWENIANRLNFTRNLKAGFDFTDYLVEINNTYISNKKDISKKI